MSSTWVFQDSRAKQKLGADAPWSVGWLDTDGKRRSKSVGAKSRAQKLADKIRGQLEAGTFQATSRVKWPDFRQQYERTVLANTSANNQSSSKQALDHFERVIRPVFVRTITTATIDQFVAARRVERGAKPDSFVSVATINKELRHLRAAMHVAHEYKHLPELPKVKMLREPETIPSFVSAEHFAALYRACDVATRPGGLSYDAATWWRGLLTFLYMTGWRIGETLALRREDADLERGTALTRAGTNKGKRDDLVPLHPVIVEHLRQMPDFRSEMFPWDHNRRQLWDEFHAIQTAAEIHLPCHAAHEHTSACHFYGFHDFRRAFATVNAESMTGDALQRLMRHRSYTTTQRYINLAGQLNRAVANLHVPAVLRSAVNG